jgi:TDG/mug DNA glycosylase family protein
VISDVVAPGLRIVFCGTALGSASARRSAYYAGPGNKFWPTLHAIGLTARQLAPEEYPELLTYGLGLTDICKTRAGSDAEVGRDAFDVPRLRGLIEAAGPAWLAFNGKNAAKAALGLERVGYGAIGATFGRAPAFVLPSTSGAANRYWDIAPWHELAERAKEPQ